MYKFLSISCLAILLGISSLKAQVENYALTFSTGGNVSFGVISELNNLSSYTIQFWMCPSEWKQGATVYSRGDSFSARMGVTGELIFTVGSESVSVALPANAVNKWVHLSFINDNGNLRLLVNNQLAKSEMRSLIIPQSEDILRLGGGFVGRIDEFRIWGVALSSDNKYMWQNTLNKFHPQWNQLISYYKFDQNLCPNVVDYTFHHHGTFSATGVSRELVSDNEAFKYFIVAAYTDFSRFSDRAIDKDKYLLANTLIILGINSASDGSATLPYPFNHGTVSMGSYLAEYNGRKGVLALNGEGAKMDVGTKALGSKGTYTFHTWIYLEEWTEGAFIFKKEESQTKGFSIRLGAEDSKQVIVRMDGREYIVEKKMLVGEWMHLGISTFQDNDRRQLYLFAFNGIGVFPTRGNYPDVEGTYILSGLDNVSAAVGENLHAKLDNTVIWAGSKDGNALLSEMNNGVPMPGIDKMVEASIIHSVDSYWMYDNPEDMGYDYYSYKHFVNIMRSAYDGHRGFKIMMSVSGHSGWETTFADAAKRKRLGVEIAAIANESDFDGVDLDFEWTYSEFGWTNYAKVVEQIKLNLKPGKLLTVTPHKVAYWYPLAYMKDVDYFLFQIYGPSRDMFTADTYERAFNSFVSWGYPRNKIVMSYAATSSVGCDAAGSTISAGDKAKYPPVGVRNLFNDSYSPDQDRLYEAGKDCYRYITGYNQTLWRNEFVRTNGARGIFYWDMGNDVKTSHSYSLVKGASFSLNANVDTLVTKVDNAPSVGIETISCQKSEKLIISPNPAKEHITWKLPADVTSSSVMIYNLAGQCMINKKTSENTVSVNNLSEGTYFVSLYTTTGEVWKGIVIKI